MSMLEDEPNLQELLTRLVELEAANAHMREKLLTMQAAQITGDGQEQVQMQVTPSEVSSEKPKTREKQKSRRGLLRKVIGIAAAVVGAGALSQMNEGTALAATQGSTT